MESSNENYFYISDLSVAAYLTMKGLLIISCKKCSNGKFEFIIDDKDGQAKKLYLEYINSDFCKFDNQVRSLKKMLYKG